MKTRQRKETREMNISQLQQMVKEKEVMQFLDQLAFEAEVEAEMVEEEE